MFDLSQLNICFLAGTLGQGGAERQLYYLLKTLYQNGARVRVYSLTTGEVWEERFRAMGIPVIWIGRNSSRLARQLRLIKELKTDRPAIIQSQHFYTNIYASLAARIFGLIEIGSLRNDTFSEVRSVGETMGHLSLRLPRMIFANSQLAIRNAVSMGVPEPRLRLIRNVVDTEKFIPVERKEARELKILGVGRLVQQKRFDRFLRVIALSRENSPYPIKALIAGDGPQRGELERLSAELGIRDSVEFRGEVACTRSIYQESDLLLLTSDWEGSPNVVLEAMACGLPVVATSVGDLAVLVLDHENGFIADASNEKKIVASLSELLQNSDLRAEFGRRARQRVVAEYSLNRLPLRLQTLYQSVLDR